MFAERLNPCAICGGHIMGQPILDLDKEGKYHKLCVSCSQKSQCEICFYANRCDFNNRQIHPELQPYVMKVIRQGPMTVQNQVINEERIKVVCKTCKCYNPEDKESYCRKGKMKCSNYDPKWRD